jgi:8-oxo-dGTP pyrophosphatase MutT (NUDIX family)
MNQIKQIFAYRCALEIHDTPAPAQACASPEIKGSEALEVHWNVDNWTSTEWETGIQLWMQQADQERRFHAYAQDAEGRKKHMDIFISLFTLITAAGGIVTNPSGDILCIYRKGHWDLPKGKVDPGESIQAAALREVEEETHASQLQITGPPLQTLHVYTEKKQRILKSSWWYPMHTQSHQALQPQLEEDIHKAEWVAPESLYTLFPEMYPMIRELLLIKG